MIYPPIYLLRVFAFINYLNGFSSKIFASQCLVQVSFEAISRLYKPKIAQQRRKD